MQDISFVLLGFFTGISLILAIGAQNIFVIEQGLKRQYVFLVCLICSISDLLLIFFGIFLFEYFQNFFSDLVELILNILLLNIVKDYLPEFPNTPSTPVAYPGIYVCVCKCVSTNLHGACSCKEHCQCCGWS